MATPKKAAKDAPAVDENEDFADYINYESLNPALEQIRADLGITGEGDVTCHVSKLDADGKGTEFKVWQGDPDQYDLEALAKRYGSGQYRIMVYMKIPSGHKVRQINKVQAWMLSPEDEARVQAARNPPEEKQADQNTGLAAVMVQGFQQLGELIVKATQKPEVDPLKQMEAMAGIIRVMMPAAAPAAPAGPGFMEIMNMVKTFNDVAGIGKPSLPEGADSSTALMMAGMDMFKPVIAKAMEQKAAQAPVPVPTSVDQSDSRLTLPAPVPETEPEEIMLFKLQLKEANKFAARSSDPAEFADSIYGILPDAALHDMAVNPAWFSFLVQIVPECEQHKAWYEGVRNALIAIAVEDGVFIRGADDTLTLPPEDGHNAANPTSEAANAAGKPSAT